MYLYSVKELNIVIMSIESPHKDACVQQELSGAAVSLFSRWGALVVHGCGELQPVEVKLMSAEVLVKAVHTLLTAPALPLGECTVCRRR